MFWLALAAQLSPPVLLNPKIFSEAHFPDEVPTTLLSRTVSTRTVVRPDGTIQGCTAEVSSGVPRIDAFACQVITSRARFAPATWLDGTAAYGVLKLAVVWTPVAADFDEGLETSTPDIDLTVNHLPQRASPMTDVSLALAIDANGRPLTCTENPIEAKRSKWVQPHFPELIAIGCREAMSTLTLPPPIDASGKAVRSVQNALVRFKIDQKHS